MQDALRRRDLIRRKTIKYMTREDEQFVTIVFHPYKEEDGVI